MTALAIKNNELNLVCREATTRKVTGNKLWVKEEQIFYQKYWSLIYFATMK